MLGDSDATLGRALGEKLGEAVGEVLGAGLGLVVCTPSQSRHLHVAKVGRKCNDSPKLMSSGQKPVLVPSKNS